MFDILLLINLFISLIELKNIKTWNKRSYVCKFNIDKQPTQTYDLILRVLQPQYALKYIVFLLIERCLLPKALLQKMFFNSKKIWLREGLIQHYYCTSQRRILTLACVIC